MTDRLEPNYFFYEDDPHLRRVEHRESDLLDVLDNRFTKEDARDILYVGGASQVLKQLASAAHDANRDLKKIMAAAEGQRTGRGPHLSPDQRATLRKYEKLAQAMSEFAKKVAQMEKNL